MSVARITKGFIFLLLLGLYGFFLFQQVNLPTEDLGRHLKTGELVFKHPQVLTQNFYSYIMPEKPAVNHHWLSGVIFYRLFKIGGFKLLVVFHSILLLAAFGLAWRLAKKASNFWVASFWAVPAILLLAQRVVPRPESFSYLFFIVFLWALFKYRANSNFKIWWLVPLQVLWVNLHIYFIFGPALVGLFLLEHLIKGGLELENIKAAKKLALVFAGTVLAMLVNPNFIAGALMPFTVFRNYGYDIVENKSPLFLENVTIDPTITVFKVTAVFLVLSLYFISRKRHWSELVLAIVVLVLGFMAIRNLPLLALVSLVVVSTAVDGLKPVKQALAKCNYGLRFWIAVLALVGIVGYVGNQVWMGNFWDKYSKDDFGLGLTANAEGLGNFLQENELPQPIFNNYDIGSYLVYYLLPQQKIFVDNRPEAYSVDFFKKTYVPMQQDENVWQRVLQQYSFKTIIFGHTDGTPWARQFLEKRLSDPDWGVVYFDQHGVVLKYKHQQKPNYLRERAQEVQTNFPTLRSWASLANFLFLAGDLESAKKINLDILAKDPQNQQAFLELSSITAQGARRQDFNEAILYLEKALDVGPALPLIYNQLGVYYFYLDAFLQAKESWQRALKLDSGNETARSYLEQYRQLRLP